MCHQSIQLLGLYVDICRRIPGRRKKPVCSGCERFSIERVRTSEETGLPDISAVISVTRCKFSSLNLKIKNWRIEINDERISHVNFGSTPCAATRFSFVVTAWIIDEGFLNEHPRISPVNVERDGWNMRGVLSELFKINHLTATFYVWSNTQEM